MSINCIMARYQDEVRHARNVYFSNLISKFQGNQRELYKTILSTNYTPFVLTPDELCTRLNLVWYGMVSRDFSYVIQPHFGHIN